MPQTSSPATRVRSPWQQGDVCCELKSVSTCPTEGSRSEALVGASPARCGFGEPVTPGAPVPTCPFLRTLLSPAPPAPQRACGRRGHPAYQMLSLSATATHGVKGWNLTTEGTPGFLFRKIWSSSFAIPARRDTATGLSVRPMSCHGGRGRVSRPGTREAAGDTQAKQGVRRGSGSSTTGYPPRLPE